MVRNVWLRPVSEAGSPDSTDTARCAVCGETAGEDGVIVDVLTAEGRHVYRALCSSDAACPTEIADVVRLMRTPPSPGR